MRIRRKLLELPSFYCGTRACTHLSLNNVLASSNWRWFIPWWKGSKHLYWGGTMTQLLGISCSIVAVLVLHTQDFKSNFWGFCRPQRTRKGWFYQHRIFLCPALFSLQHGVDLEVYIHVIKETTGLDRALGLLFKMSQSFCNAPEKELEAGRGWSQSQGR